MRILVTGSSGHLGQALIHTFSQGTDHCTGVDILPSAWTHQVGSIADRPFVRRCMADIDVVLHAATLHKPHVGTHSRQDFIDTNITGTLNLLEEAAAASVKAFIYTSTTSTFGDAMRPAKGAPAVWVTESLQPKPKNIYGVTKTAAEDLCRLFSRNHNLPCVVLRTSRFFPEEDDNRLKRTTFDDENLKVNELLFRRIDIADIVSAHQRAIVMAPELGFDRFIISATTPFRPGDANQLGLDAPSVVAKYVPEFVEEYRRRNWLMFQRIERVYDNSHACNVLGWTPEYSFAQAIRQLTQNLSYKSPLTMEIGNKGYHPTMFSDGPYPVDD